MDAEINNLEPNFSTLILSLASSAAIALGMAPDPQTQKVSKNLKIARFNIDLLQLLQTKTKNNLSSEEDQFLKSVLSDLQMHFVQAKG